MKGSSGILGLFWVGLAVLSSAWPFGLCADPLDLPLGHTGEMLARAWPDELFYGLGDPRNLYVRGGVDPSDVNWPAEATPKVNQSYVWGLAKAGDNLFFGTHANGHLAFGDALFGSLTEPSVSDLSVAEYGLGVYGQANGLPEGYGDWRPPLLARYNLTEEVVYDLTADLPPYARALLRLAQGFRSAGVLGRDQPGGGVVVLAGPPINPLRGLIVFTFNAQDGSFAGAMELVGYNNIRRLAEYNGDLYAGVESYGGMGAVMRASLVNRRLMPRVIPVRFTEVGRLDLPGSDIAVHEGRLFVSTWPWIGPPEETPLNVYFRRLTAPMGIWMSPPIPRGGLTALHSQTWRKVWSISHYDPDPLVAMTIGGGAMRSYGGWLYFGTMQPPYIGAFAHFELYGQPASEQEMGAVLQNTSRGTALFRMRNFETRGVRRARPDRPMCEVELLYGHATFKVYDRESASWVDRPNLLEQTPRMGGAGLGNYLNIYTWSMATYQGRLYLGTAKMGILTPTLDELLNPTTASGGLFGGALYCLASPDAAAFVPLTDNGFGNVLNIGIRTLVGDDDGLFAGTGNIYNLMGDPQDEYPDGGWELWRLTRNVVE